MWGRRKSDAPPAVEPVTVALAGIQTITPPPGPVGYVTGWKSADVPSASDQIGVFAGTPWTQRGGNVLEVQRWQGVEGLSSTWYTPPQLVTPSGRLNNMQAANLPGVQRVGGGSNGQLGPITARKQRANVTAQQIRQSGLAAVQWAQALSPQ